MDLKISLAEGLPIYQQIVEQVRFLAAAGKLTVGDELPTIRALAEQLQINPNTVARAYRELEAEGLVEKRSTHGTFFSGNGSPLARKHRLKILHERLDQLLALSRQLGFSIDDVTKHLQERNANL